MPLGDTEFYRRASRKLMMIIKEGMYFTAANAAETYGDRIFLGGLSFPLRAGSSLFDEERDYIAQQSAAIQEIKTATERAIVGGSGLEVLRERQKKAQEISFFLKSVVLAENGHLKINLPEYNPRARNASETEKPQLGNVWASIIYGPIAVINQRVYPLMPSSQPGLVYLSGNNFNLGISPLTTGEIENRFKEVLTQQIVSNCYVTSEASGQILRETEQLESENSFIATATHLRKYSGGYECGNWGFVLKQGKDQSQLYYLIPEHYNGNTGMHHKKGESAVIFEVSGASIIGSSRFGHRSSLDSPFTLASNLQCYGHHPLGDDLSSKLAFLREAAGTIAKNGAYNEYGKK